MLPSVALTRRAALTGGGAFLLTVNSKLADAADAEEWQAFKDRFLLQDGRVIDTGNLWCDAYRGPGLGDAVR